MTRSHKRMWISLFLFYSPLFFSSTPWQQPQQEHQGSCLFLICLFSLYDTSERQLRPADQPSRKGGGRGGWGSWERHGGFSFMTSFWDLPLIGEQRCFLLWWCHSPETNKHNQRFVWQEARKHNSEGVSYPKHLCFLSSRLVTMRVTIAPVWPHSVSSP